MSALASCWYCIRVSAPSAAADGAVPPGLPGHPAATFMLPGKPDLLLLTAGYAH